MGNCQAINNNSTLLIQHPNGKVDEFYCPVSAKEIINMNPGHYVALLLTTTVYNSSAAAKYSSGQNNNRNSPPLRITRIKLLRPTDTLALGHVYRLVTNQDVMKGLWAKKQVKMQHSSDFEAEIRKTDVKKTSQVIIERHKSRNNTPVNSAASKSRAWQPALKSISEAGG